MTWKNWNWIGGDRWFPIVMSVVAAVLLVILYGDDETPIIVKWILAVLLIVIAITSYSAHTWITVKTNEVRIGFFPLYRRSITYREIRDLSIVTVKPVRQFGGFGVRGWARSKRGLLLGGHPSEGLKFETFGDRRYIITPQNIEPIVQELARHGCTLSAGNSDDFSEEV